MLSGLRKAYHNSLIVKIMLGLLTLSFGAWGIGDILDFRASSQPAIIVGDDKIDPATVATEFRKDEQNLQQQMGNQKLTDQQAMAMGLMNQTIQRLVGASLISQDAAANHMIVDDGTLRATIAAIPAFRNAQGAFDPQTYAQALQGAGMNEPQFINLERSALLRSNMVTAITAGIGPPAVLLDPMFAFQEEKRTADLISVPAADMPAPPPADDATLQAFYKGHNSTFTTPELRALTAVVLSAKDVAAQVKPTDDQVKQAYQEHIADFGSLEQRQVAQVLFDKEADAKAFADGMKGKDFAAFQAAAKAAGKTADDLGTVERGGLPLPVLSDAVFGSPGAGVVGPVQTPLGFHVLDVVKVVPPTTRPLDQVRDQVVQTLVASQAQDKLTDLANKLDDALGSGASLDEAAGKVSLTPVKIAATDAQGKDPDGKPAAGVPDSPAFLQTAFQTASGASSDLQQMDGDQGYFVVRVDKVTPPALKTYDQVKDQVGKAWVADQQEQAARKAADAMAQRLKNGEAMATVAGSFKFLTSDPFGRNGDERMPPLVAATLFGLKVGETTTMPAPGGTIVARLKSIVPADKDKAGDIYAQTAQSLAQAMANDVAAQYVTALQRKYGVKINQQAINSQFASQ